MPNKWTAYNNDNNLLFRENLTVDTKKCTEQTLFSFIFIKPLSSYI